MCPAVTLLIGIVSIVRVLNGTLFPYGTLHLTRAHRALVKVVHSMVNRVPFGMKSQRNSVNAMSYASIALVSTTKHSLRHHCHLSISLVVTTKVPLCIMIQPSYTVFLHMNYTIKLWD